MTDQERAIFATAHQDYEAAFGKLFSLYVNDIYRAALGATFYNEQAAMQLTLDIFTNAYKFLHQFSPQHSSFRLYLFSLIAQHLNHREDRIPPLHDIMPKRLKHHLSQPAQRVWYLIQQLPTREWLIFELWHGANLTTSELSIVLNCSLTEVQALQSQALHLLRTNAPTGMEYLETIYRKRNAYATLSATQQLRFMRIILERKRLRMTFIQKSFWQRFSQPSTLLGLAVVILVTGGLIGAVIYRGPIQAKLAQQNVSTDAVNDLIAEVTKRRPSFLKKQGDLPEVEVVRKSLTEVTDTLYGSTYVVDTTNQTDIDGLTPTFATNFKPEDYVPVESTYIYTVPEALTEDQLQYAALKHFVSLPLNQFTYVNGTYYVAEDPAEFRPLFIAFNNTGSIDFQMRQAAICDLDKLTEPIADTQAQEYGFEFLTAHKFVEVQQADLHIVQVSSPDRTVAKDAFCSDGDQTPVQDRLLVYYPPHTFLKYGEDANAELPLRVRGMAVQLHGKHVTNLRIDPLFSLINQASRGSAVPLRSLNEALVALQSYHYPSEAERADAERNQIVFPQTNHLYGSDRIVSTTLDSVDLEYAYDALNHRIEPYYVFTGLGTDGNGKTNEARWYVAASTESLELRGPYRE
jgi:RNA polymerase sigma factor (sigma-70 family)